MNHDCIKEIESYCSRKKSTKRSHLRAMDEFHNFKDDDKDEDEKGAARVKDETVAREGEGVEAREDDVAG